VLGLDLVRRNRTTRKLAFYCCWMPRRPGSGGRTTLTIEDGQHVVDHKKAWPD
jgi:hypothetical protein